MKAVVLREFGPPDRLRLEEVPDPEPGPGELLVATEFASITFVETQVRAGRPPNPAMLPALPVVLGNGVGGVVRAAGPGVEPPLVGRRVVTTTGGSGGYAEGVAVAAALPLPVPEGVALGDATALVADGRTAVGLIEAAGLEPGDVVLVEAAAGGVGSLLVQLARSAGAEVVATAGGSRKGAIAAQLGARTVADHREPEWAERVRRAVGQIDVVFDGVGGTVGRAAFGLLGAGGRFVRFGMASGSYTVLDDQEVAARGVELRGMAAPTPERLRDLTERALAEAAAGRLSPVVGQTFTLERAADAHAAIEARATAGKTLLTA